jgi:hypothetical protein
MPTPLTPQEAQQLLNEFHQTYSEETGVQFRTPYEAVARAIDDKSLSLAKRSVIHDIARIAGAEPHLQFLKFRSQLPARIDAPQEPVVDIPFAPWVKDIRTQEDMQRANQEMIKGLVGGAAIGTAAAVGGPVVQGALAVPLIYSGLKGLYGTLATAATEGLGPAWEQAKTGVSDFFKQMTETPSAVGQTLGGLIVGPFAPKYAAKVPVTGRMYKPRMFDTRAVKFTEHAGEVPSVLKQMKEHYDLAYGGGMSNLPGSKKAPIENIGIRMTVDAGRQMERVPVTIERPSPLGGTTRETIEAVRFGDRYFNMEGRPIEEIGTIIGLAGKGQPLLQQPKDLVLANDIARLTTGEVIGNIKRGFIGHQPVNKERLLQAMMDKVKDLTREEAEQIYTSLRGDAKQVKIQDLIDDAAWMNRIMETRLRGISNPNDLRKQRMIMADLHDKRFPQLRAAFREVVTERVAKFDPEAAKAWTIYSALSEVQKTRPKQAVPLGKELHIPPLSESLTDRFKNFRLGGKFETKLYGQIMNQVEKTALKEGRYGRKHVKKLVKLAEAYPEAGDLAPELKPRTVNIEPLIKALISTSPTTVRHAMGMTEQ